MLQLTPSKIIVSSVNELLQKWQEEAPGCDFELDITAWGEGKYCACIKCTNCKYKYYAVHGLSEHTALARLLVELLKEARQIKRAVPEEYSLQK